MGNNPLSLSLSRCSCGSIKGREKRERESRRTKERKRDKKVDVVAEEDKEEEEEEEEKKKKRRMRRKKEGESQKHFLQHGHVVGNFSSAKKKLLAILLLSLRLSHFSHLLSYFSCPSLSCISFSLLLSYT